MSHTSKIVKVAVTQQEPLWFDIAGAIRKTCELIGEAANNGAQLIAFPEVWICGYPAWIWSRSIDPAMATTYIKNSLSYDSPEMAELCAAAKKHKITVVLGFSENDHNSLYIAQCTISATGEILNKRRKLKPTHMERTVFGDASGNSLFNVVDVEGVGRVGALNCFEHTQPLLKYHTISQKEQIHVSAWPPLFPFDPAGEDVFSISAEGVQSLSQAYAIESGTFVLHCTSVLSTKGISAMKTESTALFNKVGGGQSAVYGPDGRRLTEPIASGQEGIVYADLPMDFAITVKHILDVVGHYSRPDLLWLGVDGREKLHVRMTED
ncbi:carbon-nitrogen hydrolase [Lophiostoma macrostomum CBS 122681]|uniref:nitrilase n=1 Tax=Lophiostoma macrostomum CBS 122681 TaxID=1314788 RepID=A0A6A6T7S2_9PLEO|nr:carbon-nitrogen hydrolase [Lophiostoma macrostomum CBS 122681]